MDSKTSPAILEISWGKLKVQNQEKVFKDAKLFPGGSRAWDWNETGTKHTPGILPDDVIELLNYGAKVIVLSKGFLGRLLIKSETIDLLAKEKIPFYILDTKEAATMYNKLAQKDCSPGGLFHTTC